MNPEPETPNPNPVDTSPAAAASSQPEILNLGPPRNGKIAKLPKELRDLINRMLADRAGGSAIITALAERGISLNHENISNWKHGGYEDWLLEQDWQAEMIAQRESAAALLNTDDETKFQQAVIQLAVTQIFQALKKGQLNNDPANYTRLLNALSRLAREAFVMKKYRDYCAKTQVAELKQLDTNRDLSDKEYDLLINKMDQVFKVPRRPKSVPSIVPPKSDPGVPPPTKLATNGSP